MLFRKIFIVGLLVLSYCGLPPCPIYNCQVRQEHHHWGKEYRGRKWYKKQNLQVGERWKEKRYADEIQVNYGLAEHNAKAVAYQRSKNKNSFTKKDSAATSPITVLPSSPSSDRKK
ncbi:MAG: hypothetical protein NZM38_04780 [Cytophagales bacterium]|nr:hypothetical protein [Cytophagales bacterium]MDW8384069.1 hypothetical protein [Flammeovirgaceae bacterium]